MKITGDFDVKTIPQPEEVAGGGPAIGRMLLDKVFHGPLEATSKGQMIAALTAVQGSAGYVAMEIVTGSVEGMAGTFVLQHSGTMNKGEATLNLGVVPDSGTGELAGLSGTMEILREGGKHSYVFEYTLPTI
jgi:hypothetical protein